MNPERQGGLLVSKKFWTIALLILVLLVPLVVRLRLLGMPLERDEGEFAYAAQLLLHGDSPYQGAYNTGLKLPGTVAGYAVSMAVFGQTATAIHLGVVFINLATALLLFVLGKRIAGAAAGVVAAGVFSWMSINPEVLGLAAHATHFVMLPAVAGLLLLQDVSTTTSARKIFCAGFLLGLAFVAKQTGAFFCLFGAIWMIWWEFFQAERRWKRLSCRLLWLALGGTIPFALTCLIVAANGDFGRFWFWAFEYARAHGSVFSFREGLEWMRASLQSEFDSAPGLWSLALLGLVLLIFNPAWKRWRFFIFGLAVFSFLAICPGGYFREHYFIQLLPVTGLLVAVVFRTISDFFAKASHPKLTVIASLLVGAAMLQELIDGSHIYFFFTPEEVCRTIYPNNPFVEAIEVGDYLEKHCPPDRRIAVLGSEPEIFFYSRLRSATGYICTYPLMEKQPYAAAMREEMVGQIKQAAPAYVVFVNVHCSWMQDATPPDPGAFQWFETYRAEHLQLVGVVDIPTHGPTVYQWIDSGSNLSLPKSTIWLAVFKERDTARD